MGLAAFLLVATGWLYEMLGWILFSNRVVWPAFQHFAPDALYLEIYAFLTAPFLSLAWKGLPRLQLFLACIFVHMFSASFMYT